MRCHSCSERFKGFNSLNFHFLCRVPTVMEDLEMSRDFKTDFQAWKTHELLNSQHNNLNEIEVSLCECHLYIKIN